MKKIFNFSRLYEKSSAVWQALQNDSTFLCQNMFANLLPASALQCVASPLCVISEPNSGYIAHYAPFLWHKSPTNCDAYLPESNFQTRSGTSGKGIWKIGKKLARFLKAQRNKKTLVFT